MTVQKSPCSTRGRRRIAGLFALGLLAAAPAPTLADESIAPPVHLFIERPEVSFVHVSPVVFRSHRCHGRHRRVVVTFDITVDARVAGHINRLRRHSAPRHIRTFRFDAFAGPARARQVVPVRGLRPGRYRLWLRARNEGGKSQAKKTEFRVKGC